MHLENIIYCSCVFHIKAEVCFFVCFLVGFEPNATMDTAHHMLLYGCTKPGTDDLVWLVDWSFSLF